MSLLLDAVAAWLERAATMVVVAALLLLALALVAGEMTARGFADRFRWVESSWLIAPLLAGAAALEVARTGRVAACLLLALLLVQRRGELGHLYRAFPERDFYPAVEPLRGLPAGGEPYRVVALGYQLTPNSATMWELEDVRGYNAMTFRRLANTFPLFASNEVWWFNRVDALAPAETPRARGWRERARGPGWKLLENLRRLPRAFVPHEIHWGGGAKERLAARATTNDSGRSARLERRSGPAPEPRVETNAPGEILALERRGTGNRLRTRFDRLGWVVVSETAWRGWRARTDGGELPLAFANHAFLAFEAPTGEHEIELFFRPRSFEAGAARSAASALGLGALALLWRRRRRAAGARGEAA